MYLALTYDHRIIDGKEAVTFLVRIKELIEDPHRFLLDLYEGREWCCGHRDHCRALCRNALIKYKSCCSLPPLWCDEAGHVVGVRLE